MIYYLSIASVAVLFFDFFNRLSVSLSLQYWSNQ